MARNLGEVCRTLGISEAEARRRGITTYTNGRVRTIGRVRFHIIEAQDE